MTLINPAPSLAETPAQAGVVCVGAGKLCDATKAAFLVQANQYFALGSPIDEASLEEKAPPIRAHQQVSSL